MRDGLIKVCGHWIQPFLGKSHVGMEHAKCLIATQAVGRYCESGGVP